MTLSTSLPRFAWRAACSAAWLLAGCTAMPPTPPERLTPQRIAEIVASPDRSAADRQNDLRRKPADMLAFIGCGLAWWRST